MNIKTFKTHPVVKDESIFQLIDNYIPSFSERSILVITSKIISICEGSVVEKKHASSKIALIQQSADAYLKSQSSHSVQITIKNNALIPSAGIDESNGNGLYILYPKDLLQSTIAIWKHVRKIYKIKNLGVLITDSHTTPLRRGVIGIGLGWCGFNPLYDYVGKPDCFGVPLCVSMRNNVDALAAAAVFCMGEGNEQTPFATITNAPKIEFQSTPPKVKDLMKFFIPLKEDLYAPFLESSNWVYGSFSK